VSDRLHCVRRRRTTKAVAPIPAAITLAMRIHQTRQPHGVKEGSSCVNQSGIVWVYGPENVNIRSCYSQALAGDSAFTVYHCAELDAVLTALGPRGYRAAQMEAGIVAGRLNLAAFALGLGASSLTFIDSEVRSRFGGDCMLVTSMWDPRLRQR
jgi:Nitroreductase family